MVAERLSAEVKRDGGKKRPKKVRVRAAAASVEAEKKPIAESECVVKNNLNMANVAVKVATHEGEMMASCEALAKDLK